LLQWPVVELEKLRGHNVQLSNQKLNQGDHVQVKGITVAQVCFFVCFIFFFLEKIGHLSSRNNYRKNISSQCFFFFFLP